MKTGLKVEWKLASRYNPYRRFPGGELDFWYGNWILNIAFIEDFLMILDYELNSI
jgi:hypothetical protein